MTYFLNLALFSFGYSKQDKTIKNDLESTFENCDNPTLDEFCEHNNQ